MDTTYCVVYKENEEMDKIVDKYVCTGCGKEFELKGIRIHGPDTLHPPQRTFWCYSPFCVSKQKLFNAIIQKKLDEQGRKLIREAREAGDSELEECAMLIYMADKMEPVEKGVR